MRNNLLRTILNFPQPKEPFMFFFFLRQLNNNKKRKCEVNIDQQRKFDQF